MLHKTTKGLKQTFDKSHIYRDYVMQNTNNSPNSCHMNFFSQKEIDKSNRQKKDNK